MEFVFSAAYSTEDRILVHRAYAFGGVLDAAAQAAGGLLLDIAARPAIIVANAVAGKGFAAIEKEFGEEVAKIASGAVAAERHEHAGREHGSDEARERYYAFLDTVKDPRVALLMLCRQTARLQESGNVSPSEQAQLAETVVRAFVPLARQMGLPELERGLARLCLSLLPKWDYQRAEGESVLYEALIAEKAYHQNKLHLCLL